MDKEPKNKILVNKSHAAAYAVNSIRTAWLACHYPEIFRKSLLNVFIINQDKVKLYLSEIVQKDIPLLPPSVNYSEDLFSIENKKSIRFGLGGIKRVKKLALAIQDERKERGFFSSYRDFVERIITYQNGNKAAIESLVLAGALDDFNGTRKAKIAMIEPLIERLKSGIEYQVDGQSTIFQLDDSLSVFKDLEMPNIEEYDENTMYFNEEEVTGLFITGHPLDKYLKTLSILGAVNLSELLSQEDEITGESIPSAYLEKEVFISGILSEVTSKNSKSGKMFTFKLKDRTSEIRCVAFNKILTTYGEEIFKDNQLVTIHGKLTNNEFGDQIIVQTIGSIDNLPTDIKEIEIIVSNDFDEAKKQGIELEKALKDETGDTVVYCSYENKNGEVKKWNPSQFSKIHISYSVFSEIQRIVGERNVILK